MRNQDFLQGLNKMDKSCLRQLVSIRYPKDIEWLKVSHPKTYIKVKRLKKQGLLDKKYIDKV